MTMTNTAFRSLRHLFFGAAVIAGTTSCASFGNTPLRHGEATSANDDCEGKITFYFNSTGPRLPGVYAMTMFSNDGSKKTERWQKANGYQNFLMRDPRNVESRERWYAPIAHHKDSVLHEKLLVMDEYIDRNVEYTADPVQYGLDEFWAPPLKTMSTRKGDCEDIAWLKYDGLRYLGVEAERMYIFTMDDHKGTIAGHAVLGVNVAKNLNDPPEYVFLNNNPNKPGAFAKLDDRTMYYARNENGIWAFPGNTMAHWTPGKETPYACIEAPKATHRKEEPAPESTSAPTALVKK